MKTTNYLGSIAILSAGFFAFAPAGASDLAPQPKIDACVAAVAAGADFSDASVVRYDIVSEQHRPRRHRLTIDAKVYDENAMLREYEAVCVVTADAVPVKFELNEVVARR